MSKSQKVGSAAKLTKESVEEVKEEIIEKQEPKKALTVEVLMQNISIRSKFTIVLFDLRKAIRNLKQHLEQIEYLNNLVNEESDLQKKEELKENIAILETNVIAIKQNIFYHKDDMLAIVGNNIDMNSMIQACDKYHSDIEEKSKEWKI